MAWAGSHSQPLTWRKGREEKDERGNTIIEEKNEWGNIYVNSQIMSDSGNLKIESLIEFPPLKSMNEEQEVKEQEYSCF